MNAKCYSSSFFLLLFSFFFYLFFCLLLFCVLCPEWIHNNRENIHGRWWNSMELFTEKNEMKESREIKMTDALHGILFFVHRSSCILYIVQLLKLIKGRLRQRREFECFVCYWQCKLSAIIFVCIISGFSCCFIF